MLTLLGPVIRDRGGTSRRGFLKLGALGLGGLALPRVLSAAESRDVSVILYWMAGGPSHIDTFDPKPDAPDAARGPFGSIATATPGARFSSLLPELAATSHHFCILRSVTHHENNHPDASHLVQTGHHEPNVQFRGQIHPAQGSIVARLKGPTRPGVPPYVCVPDAYFARQGFFQLATYLGKEFDPVNSGGEPTFRFTSPRPSFVLPPEMTVERVTDRRALLRRIDRAVRRAEPVVSGMDAAYQRAFDLVTSREARRAFDLALEPESTRARYGDNPWGRGALLARRLVESGVRFVTVNHYEADVDWWDDHYTIEKNLQKRLPPFDRALSALIQDVAQRGLAERVLIVAMGEFGRAPRVDALAGRGHWARAMSVLLAGAGVVGGRVVGATTRDGGEPATRGYHPVDILATIYDVLGIDPASVVTDQQNRPVRIVDQGRVIRELF